MSYFLPSEFVDIVLLTFVDIVFVIFVGIVIVTFLDTLYAPFITSSYAITEISAIIIKYLPVSQTHVLGF